MKIILKFTLLLASIAVPSIINAQTHSYTVDSAKNINVIGDFNGAEIHLPTAKKLPAFPGGSKAWQDFIRSNINIAIPFKNKAVPGQYKVMVRFIVRSDGTLSAIGADSNSGYGMEAEVIRCIRKSINWIPAETSNGQKVSFLVRAVVIFTVKLNDVIISFP